MERFFTSEERVHLRQALMTNIMYLEGVLS